jgi:hypothetical protein
MSAQQKQFSMWDYSKEYFYREKMFFFTSDIFQKFAQLNRYRVEGVLLFFLISDSVPTIFFIYDESFEGLSSDFMCSYNL